MKRRSVQQPNVFRVSRVSQAVMLICGMSAAAIAVAQDSGAKSSSEAKLDEVVVTGSRIQRKEGYAEVNSTNRVTAEEMRTVGATRVAEMIEQMPTNIASVTPETVGDSPTNMGETIANLRGMNTAGGTRTLTLVDGKRYVPTNEGGAVDLNVIPSALMSRMDVVTGGASATYGSNAMAGVVNIVLDKEYDGVRIDADWGQTSKKDGDNWKASFIAGTGLMNDKAHVTFSYEHSYQASINNCDTRAYCRESRGLYTNDPLGSFASFFGPILPYSDRSSAFGGFVQAPLPGEPYYVVIDGLRYGGNGVGYVNDAKFGTLRPGFSAADYALDPGGYWKFNDAGTALIPAYSGLTPAQASSAASTGLDGVTPFGEGPLAYNQLPLISGATRDSAVLYFSYLFDNDIKTSATVSYAEAGAHAQQNTNRQMGYNNAIQEDNPYLLGLNTRDQAILRARMTDTCTERPYSAAAGTGAGYRCILLRKVWTDQLPRENTNENKVLNVSLDAQGPLGDNWSWKAYANFGRTTRNQSISDWATRTRWEMASDAVRDTDGVIKCRVLATGAGGPAKRAQWIQYYQYLLGNNGTLATATEYVNKLSAGCAPVNPFGYAASAESLAYSWPTYLMETTQKMQSASLTASGELWQGWGAGPLRVAGGVDYDSNRSDSTINTDPILATDILVAFGGAWSGRTTNLAPFAEVEMPLLRDLPGVKSLLANASYRWTHNKTERFGTEPLSSSRNIEAWKGSLVWAPIDSMRVRATYSQDVRAPSARELYRETALTIGSVFSATTVATNPWVNPTTNPNERQDSYLTGSGGNTLLKAEKSNTTTIGLVLTPEALRGLSASVDWYRTVIEGGIATVGATNVITGCYQHMTLGFDNNYCENITFGPPTVAGNPNSNIESVTSATINSQDFTSSGIDYQVSYFKPLANSSINVRLMATQFLKQDVFINNYFGTRNVAGQVGSSGIGGFFGCTDCNYTPTPRWQGNLFGTYSIAGLSSTLQIKYVGSGRLSNQGAWIGPGETGHYTDPTTGEEVYVDYAPNLNNTVNKSTVPAWVTYNLHFNYSFANSPFRERLGGLELEAHIENVLNKMPSQYTGPSPGGFNSTYYSGLGRKYNLGLRYKF